jgi:hypothetical protein
MADGLPPAPVAGPHDCPVCGKLAALYDVVDFSRTCTPNQLPLTGRAVYYCLCQGCGFLFAPEFLSWPREAFFAHIYNDDYALVDPEFADKRPREFAALVEQMFGEHKHAIRHLDFGGGEGHLSRLMREQGWRSDSWDPFFEPGSTLSGQTYDLITCFEVFEHVPDPKILMEQLTSAARDDTFILYSTLCLDGEMRLGERINWWYVAPRNGHISIFSKHTLGLLGHRHGLAHGSFTDTIHCYVKTVPDWAKRFIL